MRERKIANARERFADAIPDVLVEMADLIKCPDTSPAVKVQLAQQLDKLLALLPGPKPGDDGRPTPEMLREAIQIAAERVAADPKRGAVKAVEADYQDGRLIGGPCAGCAAKETENIMLRSALARVAGKPPNLVLAELGLVPETASVPVAPKLDERESADLAMHDTLPSAPPAVADSAPARVKAALSRGVRPAEDDVLSLTDRESMELERLFDRKLLDRDPGRWTGRSQRDKIL